MLEEKHLTLEEVAQRLGVEQKTVGKYVREGRLKAVKNPVSGSVIGFKESDIQEFITGEPVEQKTEHTESTKGNSELEKIKSDIDIAKAKSELELANRMLGSFTEFDKLKTETEAQEEELSKREHALKGKEYEVETRERAVAVLEERALYADEERKKLLLDAQNRIAKVGEDYKKKWETEDEKRRESNKKKLSFVDGLAQLVYNPPPQSISNRLQEQLITLLEPIMDNYGLHPQFDAFNRYIALEERYGMVETEVREDGRRKPAIPANGLTPKSLRVCYKACVGVYNWMAKEPTYGYDFCHRINVTARRLQKLVKRTNDDEINLESDAFVTLFNRFHRAFMAWAETYQNSRDGDWTQVVDWLCRNAEFLEERLGVGVIQEDDHLPLRMV